MSVVKWFFNDPVSGDNYTFEINPNDGGSASMRKNLVYQNTAAPGGNVLMFEGQDEAQTGEFSGVILSEAQYLKMIEWFNKRYPIQVTDDLGRTDTIYITEFTPQRKRSVNYPYKHEYTVRYTVITNYAGTGVSGNEITAVYVTVKHMGPQYPESPELEQRLRVEWRVPYGVEPMTVKIYTDSYFGNHTLQHTSALRQGTYDDFFYKGYYVCYYAEATNAYGTKQSAKFCLMT